VKPFILRRTKENVLKDLPAKQEEIIHLEMGDEQQQFYDRLKLTYQAQITEQLEKVGLAKSQFVVLDALLKLRQASLMPQLVKMDDNTVQSSAKLDYIRENIEEMLTRGHSLLIFSQFTGFLAYIRTIFDEKKIDYNYLDGQTSREDRKKLVEDFNAGKVQVFLISLKAGGVGLNLTGADYVIHMDPWWNPAVENQATDRAHRMGQTKTVFVQKLIVRNTVEEKILKLQEKKKKLIDDLFSGDFQGKLNEEDIKYIFE
jgi:non-specific serine/threonine protein kinase